MGSRTWRARAGLGAEDGSGEEALLRLVPRPDSNCMKALPLALVSP